MSDRPDDIVTFDEVVTYPKAGKRTTYRIPASGHISAFTLGGTWHSRRGEREQWIASCIGKVVDEHGGGEE